MQLAWRRNFFFISTIVASMLIRLSNLTNTYLVVCVCVWLRCTEHVVLAFFFFLVCFYFRRVFEMIKLALAIFLFLFYNNQYY